MSISQDWRELHILPLLVTAFLARCLKNTAMTHIKEGISSDGILDIEVGDIFSPCMTVPGLKSGLCMYNRQSWNR